MIDERSHVSLYYQVKEIMTENLKCGKWPINSKIPTEVELCRIYGVSRITVRQALAELEREGYLYRKQGKGTFVTTPKLEQRLSHFYSFSEEIRKMGLVPSTIVLDFALIQSDENISTNLNINRNSLIVAINRLRLADGEPYAIETSYIPYDFVAGITKEDVEKNGLYKTLKEKFGIQPNEAVESFEAVLMQSEESKHLNAKNKAPALRLERYAYENSKLIEYCVSIIKGDKYKYKILLK